MKVKVTILLAILVCGISGTSWAQSPYQELRMQKDKIVRAAAKDDEFTPSRKISASFDRLLKQVDDLDSIESAVDSEGFATRAQEVRGELDSLPIHFVQAVLEAGQPGDAVYQFASALNGESFGFNGKHLTILHKTIVAADQSRELKEAPLYSEQEVESMRAGIIRANVQTILAFMKLDNQGNEAVELAIQDTKSFTAWLTEQCQQLNYREMERADAKNLKEFCSYLSEAN